MLVNFCFYVPKTHLEVVKDAIFNAGAGVIGNYSKCCWQVEGKGQFVPEPGSNPTLGAKGKLQKVEEYKVEVVCKRELMKVILQEFLRAHPYETPAYFIFNIEDL